MKTGQNFWLYYILMVLVQIILTNYLHISPMITVSLLPAMILCLPSDMNPVSAMLVAFATGLVIDGVSEALLGINAASAVLAAFARPALLKAIFEKETIERGNGISIRKNGILKVSAALLASITLFLIVYVTADSAGMRTFWFNLGRYFCSMPFCYLLGLVAINILTVDDRR